ncbi:hypothetical protein LCGC14_0396130 [marine sediment metagenome]|uniref:Uncharacterized protein n=1 Tax=marine sediment metagenome TaxID=412755 RepID=A0A0F9VJZ7_9ZZZZ
MKKWYHSKTEIAAFIGAVALIAQLVTGTVWLDAQLQMAIVIVVFAILRVFTNKGITL